MATGSMPAKQAKAYSLGWAVRAGPSKQLKDFSPWRATDIAQAALARSAVKKNQTACKPEILPENKRLIVCYADSL